MSRSMLWCMVLVGFLAGCTPTIWLKSGATQQDFARESYECERDARQSGYFGSGLVGAVNMQSFQERCMVAKGWRKQQTTSALGPVMDEQAQIRNWCVERQPGMDLGQCQREEAARRGLPPP